MSSRVEISKKRVFMNSASSLGTRLLSISVLIWLQQYLLSRITPDEYSLLPLLGSIMLLVPLLSGIFSSGLGRFVVEAHTKDPGASVTSISSTMFPILLGAGLMVLVVGWSLAWYIDAVVNIDPAYLADARIMMALLMFSAAVRLPLSVFSVGIFVKQRFVLQNVIEVATELFRLALLFVLLFGVSTRVLWVVLSSTCAELLGLGVVAVASLQLLPSLRFRISQIHWGLAGPILKFGFWSMIDYLGATIRKAADPIILNRFATALDVSCFYVGSIVPSRLEMLYNQSFGHVVRPAIFSLFASEEYSRIRSFYLRSGRVTLWCVLAPVTPLLVYRDEIVRLYAGSVYAQAGIVLALLLLLLPITYGNGICGAMAEAAGRVRTLSIMSLTINIANLALTIGLVAGAHMGAVGSALGTFITFGLGSILLYWPFGRSLANATWRQIGSFLLAPGLMPALAAGVTLVVWRSMYIVQGWGDLFVRGMAGSMVYVVVLGVFCLKREDRDQLWSLLALCRNTLLSRKAHSKISGSQH
jgi:O-antigen/teichoic acid export membrane protein